MQKLLAWNVALFLGLMVGCGPSNNSAVDSETVSNSDDLVKNITPETPLWLEDNGFITRKPRKPITRQMLDNIDIKKLKPRRSRMREFEIENIDKCKQLNEIKQVSAPIDELNGPTEFLLAGHASICESNIPEGIQFLKRAALLGEHGAWERLSKLYDNSPEVTPDNRSAYLYYSLQFKQLTYHELTYTPYYYQIKSSLRHLRTSLSEEDLVWVDKEIDRHILYGNEQRKIRMTNAKKKE